MKYLLTLGALLVVNWLLWSGHFDNTFLLTLGGLSVCLCLWLGARMHIIDEEGAPAQMGVRPFTRFLPYLVKEIVVSNIAVSKIILARKPVMHRTLVEVPVSPKSPLGRVILANSITLTPGTVSVDLQDDKVYVHALDLKGAAEDLSGDLDRRVCELERDSKTGGAGG